VSGRNQSRAGVIAALVCLMCGSLPALVASAPRGAAAPPIDPRGEAIYRDGRLPSGEPLSGRREPALAVSGAQAACANCHKRSGLGEHEGSIKIPPVNGAYLFHPRVAAPAALDLPYVDGMRLDRDPYTPETLARAVREGISVEGRPLSYLMPRYAIDDADMALLVDYLRSMAALRVRGVGGAVVHFATVITPDADPVKRQAMLDVLKQYFADQNAFALRDTPQGSTAPAARSNAKRRWQLHIWELEGPPSEWDAELRRFAAAQPVYAVISGLGGVDWGPVHRFCEAESVPCLFPNVEAPVVSERDFYPVYFSRGVLLEAGLMARHLEAGGGGAGTRVVQVFRTDDVGVAAAAALKVALQGSGVQVVDRPLKPRTPAGRADDRQLAAAVADAGTAQALVLWLRAPDLAALARLAPPASMLVMSGLMGGLESAPVPAPWRSRMRMTYPLDLPEQRTVRVDYAMGWLAQKHMPVVAAQVQVDTYVACSMVLQTLEHMSGSFVSDYLVERLESMIEHQLISGYYPRLELAPNERFASKGGYVVHFDPAGGARILADTDWMVP
jgi:hypothetical protein